jgi:hypothetical protein
MSKPDTLLLIAVSIVSSLFIVKAVPASAPAPMPYVSGLTVKGHFETHWQVQA